MKKEKLVILATISFLLFLPQFLYQAAEGLTCKMLERVYNLTFIKLTEKRYEVFIS